jgi:hypothetical protein
MVCGVLLAACATSSYGGEQKQATSPAPPQASQPSAPAPESGSKVPESGSKVPESGSSEDEFESELARFRIAKPKTWVFSTLEADQANRRGVTVGNEAADERLRRTVAPLVVIIRHPEPYEKVNPTVRVALTRSGPLSGKSPRQIALAIAQGMKQTIPRFELEGDVNDVEVNGRPGAFFRARFLVARVDQGAKFEVLARTWVVPRDDQLFVIGMSGPTKGEDVSEAEFDQILHSIEIRD